MDSMLLKDRTFPIVKMFNRLNPSEPSSPLLLADGLGQGGFAYVYLCRQPQPPYEIMGALKVFKSARHSRMALQEANNLRKISHPLAVKIFDYGTDGFIADLERGTLSSGLPFIRMEFVKGGCLHNVLELIGPLNENEAMYFLH